MFSDNLKRLRAFVCIGLSIICYPILLLFVVLWLIFKQIFNTSKCKNISGEIAVVTGAAQGLGKEISIQLAKKGCHVAVVDINLEVAINTAKMISEEYQVNAKAYKVDVSDYEQVLQLNENVTKDLGPTTILINNAGILAFSNHLNPPIAEVQRMINVNLTAHLWTSHVFLPTMQKLSKGHIVAVCSYSGLLPLKFYTEYSTTKFGVRGFMISLRRNLKGSNSGNNIKTTTIFPFFLQTNEDVVNFTKSSNFGALYPLETGENTAKCLVQGVLRNEEEIVIPSIFALNYRLLDMLPSSWQDWFVITVQKLIMDSDYNEKMQEKPI